jgi:hypothetical protein
LLLCFRTAARAKVAQKSCGGAVELDKARAKMIEEQWSAAPKLQGACLARRVASLARRAAVRARRLLSVAPACWIIATSVSNTYLT